MPVYEVEEMLVSLVVRRVALLLENKLFYHVAILAFYHVVTAGGAGVDSSCVVVGETFFSREG